jgi:CheY-like chemotaxis protein
MFALEPGPLLARSILVVDDDAPIRNLVSFILESAHYRVFTAKCGREALEIIVHEPKRIDLLLSDVTMPEMTGIELARRARDIRPGMQILLMSGYFAGPAPAGMNMLAKPFNPAELLSRIEKLIPPFSPATPAATAVQAADSDPPALSMTQ